MCHIAKSLSVYVSIKHAQLLHNHTTHFLKQRNSASFSCVITQTTATRECKHIWRRDMLVLLQLETPVEPKALMWSPVEREAHLQSDSTDTTDINR